MTGAVETMSQQIQEIRGTKDYRVLVQRVHISKDSDLYPGLLGYRNCSVTISVGAESRQTNKVKPQALDPDGDLTIGFDQELEPFLLAGGEQNTVSILVTVHRPFLTDIKASGDLTEETLPLARLNGTVPVAANNSVTVDIQCPDARPRELPSFRAQ